MDQPFNPYLPPKSNVVMPAESRAIRLAGKGRRFGTFVVDYVCCLVLSACVAFVLVLAFGDFAAATPRRSSDDLAISLAVFLGYYLFFEGFWGRTPGKLVFGTVVVDEDGNKPSFGQVCGRTLCRCIPFEAFTFFGTRGLHDRLTRTKVVMARRP